MDLFHPPYPSEDLVWHYTNSSGLLGLLRSHTLWASSTEHMNDERELVYGRERVRADLETALADHNGDSGSAQELSPETLLRVRRFLDAMEHAGLVFLACASTDGDSVSQWRAYGGEAGYAIGLESRTPLALLARSPPLNETSRRRPALCWRRITYDSGQQHMMLDELVKVFTIAFRKEHGLEDVVAFPYWNVASLVKHEQFADEREVRMVVQVPEGVDALDFRASRFGLTPFVRLTGSSAEAEKVGPYVTTDTWRLPILHVRVGPSQYQEAHIFGVRQALAAFGYEEVEVSGSAIPLR